MIELIGRYISYSHMYLIESVQPLSFHLVLCCVLYEWTHRPGLVATPGSPLHQPNVFEVPPISEFPSSHTQLCWPLSSRSPIQYSSSLTGNKDTWCAELWPSLCRMSGLNGGGRREGGTTTTTQPRQTAQTSWNPAGLVFSKFFQIIDKS